MMEQEKTVCFTGHRTIPAQEIRTLKKRLRTVIAEQIERGATCFRTGGAMGFDTLAAEAVLELRARHPHIRLELFLPFPEQVFHWPADAARAYERILKKADRVHYTCPSYSMAAYRLRNRQLVEGAEVCIAYLTDSDGGTAYTCSLALKKGLEFINLGD